MNSLMLYIGSFLLISYASVNCAESRILTPCLLKRQQALANKIIGDWVPQCELDGSFKKTQCDGSTGNCFCVFSETGIKVLGTEVSKGKPKTCEMSACMLGRHQGLALGLFGAPIPQCDDDGSFKPVQCYGPILNCVCVFPDNGKEILGTNAKLGEPKSCKVTPCVLQRHQYLTKPLLGAFEPRCEDDGTFSKVQSDDSGSSYCVMPETGEKVLGTEVKLAKPKNCELTVCMLQRHRALSQKLIGGYTPKCDADGLFTPEQCWGSTGYCFCVNNEGVKIPGSDVRNGDPDCDAAIWNNGNPDCQQAQNSHKDVPGGPYKPVCQKNNPKLYEDTQCRGSTGYCFCVFTETGKVIKGTEVRGGKPKSCKLTPCLLQRHHALKKSEGRMMVGQVIPNCDANGSFSTTQCPGATGYCNCVFSETGERIRGTDVRGKPESCDLTVCLLQRHKALLKPLIGGFVPQCDAKGYFKATQNWGSVGISHCVSKGTGKRLGVHTKSCEATPCLLQHQQALSNSRPGRLVPQCDADGYSKTQYNPSTGYSYCVIPETGETILGTESRTAKSFSCKLTVCMLQRHQGLQKQNHGVVGNFVPKCWANGAFISAQCWPSTGTCFCVNQAGEKINGTTVTNDKPPCLDESKMSSTTSPSIKKLSACEEKRLAQEEFIKKYRHGESFGFPLVECDANGNYSKLQCPGESQICHCVDPISGKPTSDKYAPAFKLHCK